MIASIHEAARGRFDQPPTHRRAVILCVPVERWTISYKLRPVGEHVIATDVRITPQGKDSRTPVPRKVLAKMRPIEDVSRYFPVILAAMRKAYAVSEYGGPEMEALLLQPFGFTGEEEPTPRRPGRAGRPDLFYAEKAARYVEALRDHPRDVIRHLVAEDAAAGHPENDEERWRGWLKIARQRVLLTPAPPGRAGGQLTPHCRRLLTRARKASAATPPRRRKGGQHGSK
jgi:hypothetical protein